MAISRVTNFTAGTLGYSDLNSEFNNIINYINNRVLTNPLTQDIDFGDLYTIENLRSFWNIINVDEYSSLAAAESALPATGGVLFVPPESEIEISSTVTISNDNTWIVGMGPSSILRRATGTFTATQNAMILFNGRANCGVHNLQLDGQQASNSGSTGLCAVRVMGASPNFSFRGNYVRRWGEGTEASSSPNDGILIGADESSMPSRVNISGNSFENIRRSAIRVMNCRYSVISDNTAIYETVSAVGAGVHMETPAGGNGRLQSISVIGNTVQGLGVTLPTQGINLTQGSGTTSTDVAKIAIEGNTINNTSGSGIHCDNAMLSTVVGNTVGDALQSGTAFLGGIHLLDCSYMAVASNTLNSIGSTVSNSLAGGIVVTVSSNQGFHTIQGNVIREVAGAGIWAVASSTAVLASTQILGNTVSRHDRQHSSLPGGIIVEVDNTATIDGATISNNRVTLDGTTPAATNISGIYLEQTGGTFGRVLVLGNDLAGSTAGTGTKVQIVGTIVGQDISHNLEA